jgi:hypothetical protein
LTVHRVTELRLSVPEAGKRLLPLPVALDGTAKGNRVLVHGDLVAASHRSGDGTRSTTDVIASGHEKSKPRDAYRVIQSS